MFSEFSPIKGSLFTERVNSWLGTLFLGSCALWAALFVWNVAAGNNPLDHAIAAAIEHEMSLK